MDIEYHQKGEVVYAVIYFVLALCFFNIPIFGSIAGLFVPIPITLGLLNANLDKKRFLQYMAIATFVLLLLNGVTLPVVISFFYFGMLAYMTSLCIKNEVSQEVSFLVISFLITILFLLIIFIVSSVMNVSPMQTWSQYLDQIYKEIFDIYREAGISPEKLIILEDSIGKVISFLKIAIVSILYSFFATACLINFYTSIHFLSRKESNPYFLTAKIKFWKLPDAFIWGFILACLLYVLPFGAVVKDVGVNLLVCISCIYFMQGMGVISVLLSKLSAYPFLRFLIILFILFQPILMLLIVGVGIFDVWWDFRKIKQLKDQQQ